MITTLLSAAVGQNRRVAWLLLLYAMLGLAGCQDTAVEPILYGNVQGTVRDARTGQVLANVAISTTPATSSLVTDALGNFELLGVPTGRLTISAAKADYRPTTVAVTLEADQVASVAIVLEKSTSGTPPAAPVRPTPADQATVPGPDVQLAWHPVAAVPADSLKYDVALYEGSNGSSRALLTNSRDTTAKATNLLYNTTYFWQVTVRNGNGATARSALWSFRTGPLPENRYLFVRTANGNTDIYSSNGTTDPPLRLTAAAFVETAPQLSPNRDRIAYTSNATGQYQLYTMNRDGSDARRVTVLAVEGYHNAGLGYRWSPDGAQLLYAHYNQLYRINRDGTGLQLLATAPANRHFRECDWTAQGNRIVVQTIGANPNDSELYLLNADGTSPTQLVGNLPGRVDSPSFSIDGRQVLYTHDVAGFEDVNGRQLNAHIFMQNLDGSGLVDVSVAVTGGVGKPAGTNDLYPRYSPDGARIIFVNAANDNIASPEVWNMGLDGRNRTKLIDNATLPDWK